MENIHPPNDPRLTHLAQIRLCRLQILMPENHLGDNRFAYIEVLSYPVIR